MGLLVPWTTRSTLLLPRYPKKDGVVVSGAELGLARVCWREMPAPVPTAVRRYRDNSWTPPRDVAPPCTVLPHAKFDSRHDHDHKRLHGGSLNEGSGLLRLGGLLGTWFQIR